MVSMVTIMGSVLTLIISILFTTLTGAVLDGISTLLFTVLFLEDTAEDSTEGFMDQCMGWVTVMLMVDFIPLIMILSLDNPS